MVMNDLAALFYDLAMIPYKTSLGGKLFIFAHSALVDRHGGFVADLDYGSSNLKLLARLSKGKENRV